MAQTSKMGGSLTVIPLGKRLQELRKELKLKQHQVEKEAGIPPGRLSTYEASSKPIPLDYLAKLVKFYRVSAREITEPDSMRGVRDIATQIADLFEGQLVFPPQEKLK